MSAQAKANVTFDVAGTATVSNEFEMKFAMNSGVAHIVITEHLDLRALPLSQTASLDGAFLFFSAETFLTLQVRSGTSSLTNVARLANTLFMNLFPISCMCTLSGACCRTGTPILWQMTHVSTAPIELAGVVITLSLCVQGRCKGPPPAAYTAAGKPVVIAGQCVLQVQTGFLSVTGLGAQEPSALGQWLDNIVVWLSEPTLDVGDSGTIGPALLALDGSSALGDKPVWLTNVTLLGTLVAPTPTSDMFIALDANLDCILQGASALYFQSCAALKFRLLVYIIACTEIYGMLTDCELYLFMCAS